MSESNRLLNFATSSELIANGEGRNVLSAIEDGLRNCDEFLISVAFITPEGLLTLKPILKELEERGVHGRVLTTDYLGFNSPKVLEDLGSLNNIDLKVYCTTQGSNHGFHTKGYIFKKDESYQIIVGSSNLTINALKKIESGIPVLKPIAMIHMHVRLRKSLIYIGIPSLPFPMKSLFLGIDLDGCDQIILHKRILLNSLEK